MFNFLRVSFCLISALAFFNYLPVTGSSLRANGLDEGEGITKMTRDVPHKKQYHDYFTRFRQDALCHLFNKPSPRRFETKQFFEGKEGNISPEFIVVQRCDELCNFKPEGVSKTFVIEVSVYGTMTYYTLELKEHKSCKTKQNSWIV